MAERTQEPVRFSERLAQPRALLGSMVLLQALWLILIWLTGATSNWSKVLWLLVYSVAVGAVAWAIPVALAARLRSLRERLLKNDWQFLLILGGILLLAGAAYAAVQHTWNADEVRALRAAVAFAEGGFDRFFSEYPRNVWLGQHHPPLIPLINGLVLRVVGGGLYSLRLVTVAFVIGTVLVSYLLGRELYDREVGLVSASLLVSFPLLFRVGAAVMTDVQVTFFFSLTLLLVLRLVRTPSYRLAAAAGLALGAGLLTKYTMVLIVPVLLGYWIVSKPFRQLRWHLGIVVLVALGPLVIWLLFALQVGVLGTQARTLTGYAGVVIMSEWGKRFLLESLLTRLPSSVGVYNLPLILLGVLVALRRREQPDRLALLWVTVVFLLVALTLPGHRYFLPAFPGLAILMARGLHSPSAPRWRAVALSLLYCAGALYLFADWSREQSLFLMQ